MDKKVYTLESVQEKLTGFCCKMAKLGYSGYGVGDEGKPELYFISNVDMSNFINGVNELPENDPLRKTISELDPNCMLYADRTFIGNPGAHSLPTSSHAHL